MLPGSSVPPAQSGMMWSAIQPGQGPAGWPVAGQGLRRLNSVTVVARRGVGAVGAVWQAIRATPSAASPARWITLPQSAAERRCMPIRAR